MRSLFQHKLTIIGLLTGLVFAGIAFVAIDAKVHSEQDDIIDEVITLSITSSLSIPSSLATQSTPSTSSSQQKLRVIHSEKPEKGLLLFITDIKKADATSYAKQFAALSYYVAIIDNHELLNTVANNDEQCLHLADKLTELSAQLNATFNLNPTDLPILVGAENGAASLYAALAQADKAKFHAAVGINFTPQLSPHTPLCGQEKFTVHTANSEQKLISLNRLPTSFYIFQDKNLPANSTASNFASKISNAKLTIAKEENQTPLSEAIQILQWLDPRLADQISSDASDSDLPLIEVNVTPNQSTATPTMAILLTGDGGWAEIDKQVAKILAAQGIPTVGFDSLSYFWRARTPVDTSQDIENVISQYLEKWNKKQVILIGYSFGADALPFIANNLSAETQQKISLIALLGMGQTAAFEFRLSSWMNTDNNPNRLPLLPEIEKMKWANTICIYGVDDDAANCLPAAKYGVKAIGMSGDHHFDEKYDELVKYIIDNQRTAP